MTEKIHRYRINGTKSLGCLSIVFREFKKFDLNSGRGNIASRQALTPIFVQANDSNSDRKILKPGFLDYNFSYYQCPIETFFIQINEYSIEKLDSYSYNHTIKFIVFSSDYKMDKEYVYSIIEKKEYEFGNTIGLLNIINRYIDLGNSLEYLDLEYLLKRRKLFLSIAKNESDKERLFTNIIDHIIRRGQIFENSRSRARKDNEFWYEFESDYLPDDPYLTELLIKTLSDNEQSKQVRFTFGHHNAWSPSHGKIKSNEKFSNYDIFQMTKKLLENYDSEEHLKMSFDLKHG